MSGIIINLDLSLYFEDLRKYASVFVDLTKCKEVSDVEKHIKSVFKLTDNICLTDKKYLIPSREDVQILKYYETLKVQNCDFFDRRIHEKKHTKANCDQAALNLVQSERTIDLSSQNCAAGTRFDGYKLQSIPSSSVSSNDVAEEVCDIRSKEIQKNKKKRSDTVKHDINGVDILDMSVKKSKRKRNENVFSIGLDESLECDASRASNLHEQAQKRNDELEKYFKSEAKKKCKKRKKHSEPEDQTEDLSLLDSSWNNGVLNFVKMRKKRSKLMSSDTEYMVTDVTLGTKDLKSAERANLNSLEVPEETTGRQNHESGESEGKLSNHKNQRHYKKNQCNPSEENTLEKECVRLNPESSYTTCNGKQYDYEFNEQVYNGVEESHSKIFVDNKECHYVVPSSSMSVKSTVSPSNEEKSTNENLSISQPGEGISAKRKRIRRHNKKKKRERKEYFMAVGPVLQSLIVEQPKATTSSVRKHHFFTEGDFSEEVNNCSIPEQVADTMVQGYTVAVDQKPSHEETIAAPVISQETPNKPETWQQELLKLATSNTPKLVFHRKVQPSPSAKTDHQSNRLQNLAPESKPTLYLNSEPPAADLDTLKYTNNCSTNGEVYSVNCTEAGSVTEETTSEPLLKFVDGAKPIPTDFDNIVLTNYPIIDKVVAEDLILFKVLKLNENYQPDVSKTILGKVGGATNFPESICLQVIEGCEECAQFKNTSENGDSGFTIELRWADVLEPRLFYP